MAKETKSKIAVGSNKEPLGREGSAVCCQHTDKLPQGSEVIPTVKSSEAHIKTENVAGIHSGKRPKFVSHPKEEKSEE